MKVSPSLLSADFACLTPDVEMVNASDAAMLHLDVMDGRFVPNISFGFPVIKAVSRISTKPLDVHLMIVEPDRWVSQVRDCGAAIMNVHAEACTHLHRTIQAIRAAGMSPAVTLNPATPLCMVEEVLTDVDMVLLMSVNPGFGGQKFIESIVDKTRRLRRMMAEVGSHAEIEIDGGVNLETGRRLAEAGADILVAGSYVFSAQDPKATIAALSKLTPNS